ncbi:stage V sporulation protein B [Psychrobacillus sp. OK028]|uniref:oligosaccharide flippase family protein n=1 Tax=Psychrobacillus sp. OK028 TaxID=1884359 RepID=UPI0008812F90|nr:oligosaccharide flippase family protein [Psychrobacillus sp. OK028]SDN15755.1 stage V sporulation protein B [Psychrobacillus sp. OK028]
MRLPTFIKQTALRTGAIFLVKVIGLAIRIPLFRLLGSEGMGIYQIVYSVYGFALTLLSGGFPTSLALLTAKDKKQGWLVYKSLAVPILFLGTVSSLLCFAIAPNIAHFLGDNSLTFPLRCLAPALFIVPLLQLYRGFLQGVEFYGYVAVSELIEQTVRVGTMLLLVVLWMKQGTYAAAGGAVLGAFTGACIALLFLWLLKYNKRLKLIPATNNGTYNKSARWLILGPGIFLFFKSSFAITLTRIVMPASDFLDALIIPSRLQVSGLSQSEAIAIFGEVFGIATTIVYLPTIVTAAISYTMAAKLTANWQNGKKSSFVERSSLSLEIGWFWGISSMLILFFHADDLSMLIVGSQEATEAIRYMSFAPLIAGMRELTTTILWAANQKKAPIVGLLVGLICSAIAAYYLTAIPGFAYAGVAISAFILEITSLLWNALIIQKRCKGAFPVMTLLAYLIFLASIGFLNVPFKKFLLYIGIESGTMQSLGSMLFFIGCIALFLLLRFWGRGSFRRYR